MTNFSEELNRRREEEQRQREAADAQLSAKREKTRRGVLLASIIATMMAIFIVAPMRFKAIAGEEADPVEMYLASNVDTGITEAANEADAAFAGAGDNSLMLFAESIQTTSFENLSPTEHQIRMKFLEVDAEFAREGVTIDDVFASDENIGHIIAQYENALPLLDPGENSLYYVAMLDTASFNEYGTVRQAIFANNNDNGEVLSDIIYDYDKGIAYIPKSYYNTDSEPAQVENAEDEQIVVTTDMESWDDMAVTDTAPIPGQEEGDNQQVSTQSTDATTIVAPESAQTEETQSNTSEDAVVTTAEEAGLTDDTVTTGTQTPVAGEGTQQTEVPAEGDTVSGESVTEEVLAENGDLGSEYETISDEDMRALQEAPALDLPDELPLMDSSEVAGMADLLMTEEDLAPADEPMTDEQLNDLAAESEILISPIQGQLLISYDMTDSTAATVTIPVTIQSQAGNVQSPVVSEIAVPSFDTSIPIQIATPETAAYVALDHVFVYEGGSEMPVQMSEENSSYDASTGILTFYQNPLTTGSLRIVIANDDTIGQLLDAMLGTQAAMGISANDMRAWPQGKFTNVDVNKLRDIISKKQVLSYKANIALNDEHNGVNGKWLRNDNTRKHWYEAMMASRPYLYAQKDAWGSMAWLSGDALANAIVNGTDWSQFGSLKGRNNRGQTVNIDLSASDSRHSGSMNAGGTLTGVFSLPGDTGNGSDKIATNIGDIDWSGLRSLIGDHSTNYLMAGGSCCKINSRAIPGNFGGTYLTNAAGQVAMRPLYLAPDNSYVIIGFVSQGTNYFGQQYTGVYKFKLDTQKDLYVKKVSSNPEITNKYTKVFAQNCGGPVFDVYKDKVGGTKVGTLKDDNKDGISDTPVKVQANTTYVLSEVTAPNGFKTLNKPVTVKIANDQKNVVEIPNEPDINNKFRIHKVSANTKLTDGTSNDIYAENCQGAVFGVYETKKEADEATPESQGKPLTTLTVGKDGYTPYLSFGTDLTDDKRTTYFSVGGGEHKQYENKIYSRSFFIKELKQPAGYLLNTDTFEAKIDLGTTVDVPVKDQPIPGSIEVVKVDAETKKTPKDGVFEFALYDANKKEIASAGHKKSTNGSKASWDGLACGDYFVKEVAASYPYEVSDDFVPASPRPEKGKDSVSVTVSDKQRLGEVSVVKTDANDGTPLEGVSFALKATQDVTSPDGTARYQAGQPIPVSKTSDGVYKYDTKGTTTMKTAKDGSVKVTGLYLTQGDTTFQFEETATIDGHVINKNPVVLTIKKDESKGTPSASGTLTNEINSIDIYKKALKDDSPIEGVTIALWNSKNDLKVEKAGDESNYDAIAIRTPDGSEDYRPIVVKRTGSATVSASGIPSGYKLVGDTDVSESKAKEEASAKEATDHAHEEAALAIGTSDEKTDEKDSKSDNKADEKTDEKTDEKSDKKVDAAKGDEEKAHLFEFGSSADSDSQVSIHPGLYRIRLIDASGNVVAEAPAEQSIIGDASHASIIVSGNSIKVDIEKTGNQGLNATVAWDEAQHAWIANDLVAGGAEYNIEIGGRSVKVIKTSDNGGKTHYGRYATSETTLFAQGWLDQGALPKSDDNIMIKVAISNKEYEYGTVTDADGHIHIDRLPFGDYTLVEVKPSSALHTAYLADTNAHHFNVKQDLGLIMDTDVLTDGYHDGTEGTYTQTKSFIFKDDITKLNIHKREITGGPEIVGAKLTLTSFDENDIIDEWISTEEPHYIEGLKPGTYWLTERITPTNYDQAESIKFTLFPTGELQHVEMLDAPIVIDAKIDKRQEIAKPLNELHMENGDGKNNAAVTDSPFGYYDYSIDFRNDSTGWTDEFTMEDPLDVVTDDMARLTGISTPQAWQDYDGKMNVWYKTNKSDKGDNKADNKTAEKANEKADEKADDKADDKTASSDAAKAEATETVVPEEAGSKSVSGDEMTDEDAQTLSGVTATIAGETVEFDVRKNLHRNASIDVSDNLDILKNLKDEKNMPALHNLPDGWKVSEDLSQSSSSQALDGTTGKITGATTVYLLLTDGIREYVYGFDYTYSIDDSEKAASLALTKQYNATITDGHENPWLSDPEAMKNDADRDGRIIDYDGWQIWAADLPTMVSTDLSVKDLKLADGEYITAIRFEYGRVETGFTTRPADWDRTLLKDEHDDVDDIISSDRNSFSNADVAADAAMKATKRIVDAFTTEASTMAEADLQAKSEADKIRYEQLLKEIEEYNANRDAESNLPERFLNIRQKPAYEGEDDDAKKIVATRDAAKLSIQAAFSLDDTAEGRLTLRKALTGALADVKGVVDEDTYNAMLAKVLEYDSCYLTNDPERYNNAKNDIVQGISVIIDKIAETGLAGRVHYSPAILHMQVTSNYVPGTELHNSAKVDAYRNGGGDKLEAHDKDEVRQSAKERIMELATVLTAAGGQKTISYNLDEVSQERVDATEIEFIDTVTYSGLRPGVEYTMIGELHIKGVNGTDGGVVTSKGQPVRAQVTFKPENESGTIEVPMKATIGSFSPNAAVAFEELHLSVNGKIQDQVLAKHKDINDADQTVNVTMEAGDRIVPIFRGTPLAQTGDTALIIGTATILVAGTIAIVLYRHRNRA